VVDRSGTRRVEYALNLSPSGIGLHVPGTRAEGEILQLEFALPGGRGRIAARGRVIWAEVAPPGARARFRELGVRFEVLQEEDRQAILRFLGIASGAG
jgi:hypothetical protein